jgi:hypothetical protein
MRLLARFALATTMLFILAEVASACSCVRPSPPEKDFRTMPYVFMGTVVKITPAKKAGLVMPLGGKRAFKWEMEEEEVFVVTIEVRESFKGVKSSTVELVTETNTAGCGYPFEVGQTYLVYAFERARSSESFAGKRVPRRLVRSVENFNRGLTPIETSYCTRTGNVKDVKVQEEADLIRKLSQVVGK